jgi:plastocyanin
MRLVMTVRSDREDRNGAAELRSWLNGVPELRGRVNRAEGEPAPEGAMGAAADTLVAVLEPGGVAAVFAGALVAWVQTRRGNHTVTVTRADGTEITITSPRAGSMTPEELAALAERLARPEDARSGEQGPEEQTSGEPREQARPEQSGPEEGRRPDERRPTDEGGSSGAQS